MNDNAHDAYCRLHTIVSGGQTGVDRAALDAALATGLAIGGWCPRGRKALDGIIPEKYPLKETPSSAYAQRTQWNVRDSDGTLILCDHAPTGGTALTIRHCIQLSKPHLILQLPTRRQATEADNTPQFLNWLHRHHIGVLNVAGPRENVTGNIYPRAYQMLCITFRAIRSR
ncbi:MAG: hypothetical protein D6678_01795 [Zetaproteobacteria bacterium]|nr:MAG: hypothetical protein D6678_01795 [Zetaproteobacteria bacterium]